MKIRFVRAGPGRRSATPSTNLFDLSHRQQELALGEFLLEGGHLGKACQVLFDNGLTEFAEVVETTEADDAAIKVVSPNGYPVFVVDTHCSYDEPVMAGAQDSSPSSEADDAENRRLQAAAERLLRTQKRRTPCLV